MQMLHPAGSTPHLPIEVPILIAANGPKGREVARRVGVGTYVTGRPQDVEGQLPWVACLTFGTILDDAEDVAGERVRAAAGPTTALVWHSTYEYGGADAVRALPGGEAWLAVVEQVPVERRHLAVHRGHAVEMNPADAAAWDAGGSAWAAAATLTGTADDVRRRLDRLAASGVTEVVYQPAGPDIARELERFHAVATDR